MSPNSHELSSLIFADKKMRISSATILNNSLRIKKKLNTGFDLITALCA